MAYDWFAEYQKSLDEVVHKAFLIGWLTSTLEGLGMTKEAIQEELVKAEVAYARNFK